MSRGVGIIGVREEGRERGGTKGKRERERKVLKRLAVILKRAVVRRDCVVRVDRGWSGCTRQRSGKVNIGPIPSLARRLSSSPSST